MINQFKSVLINRKFRFLWTSQILSQLSINIMNFVFLIKLFETTGSAISTSLLWVAFALPAILIGPFASAIVDLTDKRKMLFVTNLFQALTIFLYAIFPNTNIFILYEVVFVYSLLNQFYVPAEAASLPSLLSKDKLTQGNSLFFLTQQGSLILGFAVAGFLNHFLGFNNTLFICSFFLFIAFVSSTFLPKLAPLAKVPNEFEEAVGKFFSHVFGGYNFIKSERKVLTPVLLLIGFQVALQVMVVEVPIIAQNLLSIPLNSAGIFILVPAGIGAILGAMILPKLMAKNWRKKRVIDYSLLGIGIIILVFTFIIPLLSYVLKSIFAFISILLLGLTFFGIIIPSQTFLQEKTPKDLRGRVFGNFWFLVTVASVFPVLFSGSIVEILGVKFFLFIIASITISIYFVSRHFGDKFING
ncbi:MAG: MFS transporter [Patescibacteria group bacterium]